METVASIALGIGLSAASGFRVFVPLLIASIAGLAGWLPLSPGMQWIGTVPALIAFATATVVEVLGYFIPWVDHLLDTLATPAAVVAGVILSAAAMVDLPPLFRWVIAVICGGGAAGLVQGATVLLRAKSTAMTGGLGNPVVATGELVGSVGTSLMAFAFPFFTLVLVLLFVVLVFRVSRKLFFGRHRVSSQ